MEREFCLFLKGRRKKKKKGEKNCFCLESKFFNILAVREEARRTKRYVCSMENISLPVLGESCMTRHVTATSIVYFYFAIFPWWYCQISLFCHYLSLTNRCTLCYVSMMWYTQYHHIYDITTTHYYKNPASLSPSLYSLPHTTASRVPVHHRTLFSRG